MPVSDKPDTFSSSCMDRSPWLKNITRFAKSGRIYLLSWRGSHRVYHTHLRVGCYIREKISSDRCEAACQYRNSATRTDVWGIIKSGARFNISCIRKEIPSKGSTYRITASLIRFTNAHCTNPVTRVAYQVLIEIVPPPCVPGKTRIKKQGIPSGEKQPRTLHKGKGVKDYGNRKGKNYQTSENDRTGYKGY